MNPDCFDPAKSDKLDAIRVAKLNKWSPESVNSDLVTPYNFEEPEDRLDLLFPAAMWHARKPIVHIAIFNSHPDGEAVTFDIKMCEMTCNSCLSEDMSSKNEVFDTIHDGIDAY